MCTEVRLNRHKLLHSLVAMEIDHVLRLQKLDKSYFHSLYCGELIEQDMVTYTLGG